MGMFQPLYVSKYETGLVQNRQNFILPNDAYPVLFNAFVWRERIKRKSGSRLLGRLRRVLTGQNLGNLNGSGNATVNIKTLLSLETNADLEIDSLTISDGTNTYTDNGNGTLTGAPSGSGIINYATMVLTITGGDGGGPLTANFNYFPALPAMGLRLQDLSNINAERTVAFDTKYAYRFNNGWQEYAPGTTWSGTDSDFFWTTNYWVDQNNLKVFWATNFSGTSGDPIRYTSTAATTWIDFAPQINSAGDKLNQCLAMLPYRGRLLVVNTWEGPNLAASVQMRQRIRWAAIGTPFTTVSALVTSVNANAWRDDITGQGGFLDIPTSEDIVSIGFVRDNLVIYCESSTWQLRYTGRSISPFQIEKVNTELGAESTFSAVQFDTSLVGIGDKGVVECDSYQSTRIDIKIPDIVFEFNNDNDGPKRVYGIRDFQQRLAYWTFPTAESTRVFPNRRLVYNYENDSWAQFIDSYTCLGTYQPQSSRRWQDFSEKIDSNQWQNLNFPWFNMPSQFPAIMGGNQQGYISYLGNIDFLDFSSNDISLSITGISGNDPNITIITCINHNLDTGQIIQIVDIPTGTDFATLNDLNFSVNVLTANTFSIYKFDTTSQSFSTPQVNPSGSYVGGGQIIIKDNFVIQSKKFNFLDQGQAINFGYMDILMDETEQGAITMNVYMDYNNDEPINTSTQNLVESTNAPDPFFNSVIPTFSEVRRGSSKNFQRIYCNARGSFITLEFTLSPAQMNGPEQESDVQIDAQILYMRPAGRQLARG